MTKVNQGFIKNIDEVAAKAAALANETGKPVELNTINPHVMGAVGVATGVGMVFLLSKMAKAILGGND